ncbi:MULTISPECIES: hypothetical protein [unclassified Enterococcus]|uniref:Uncharacterized protein n=1 Tax=Candidatus Enterococcus dunnyi TaxID=1834192 RepID=A0A200IZR1_9ENTE|nr:MULTISPECIES: hypothetical protein [unclassified Enterococcus]OUZ30463.1 hypothetical protein A5889_002751 [Enterococcus sp. 9D6_DIV0238]
MTNIHFKEITTKTLNGDGLLLWGGLSGLGLGFATGAAIAILT